MNKLLIVLLAVCLVAVHARVKREAAAEASAEPNKFDELKKQMEDLASDLEKKAKDAFDPDKLKDIVNKFSDDIKKALDGMKSKD